MVQRTPLRNFISCVFNIIVAAVLSVSISDTQCGFKMFTRNSAREIFPTQHIEHFAFDIELLLIAHRKGHKIGEVPVTWQEIPGSKVSIIKDTLKMLRDLIMTRLLYTFGLWSLDDFTI